jgi:hypothetical protein
MKISSGVSQSHRGDESFEIVQYIKGADTEEKKWPHQEPNSRSFQEHT